MIFLHVTNGTVIILLASVLAVLILYVLEQKQLHGLTWRRCIADPTAGIALALPMIGVKVGMLITRVAVWTWRHMGDMPLGTLQRALVMTGTIITALSLLSLIRVLSRARLGEWPWVATLSAALAYIAYSLCARS